MIKYRNVLCVIEIIEYFKLCNASTEVADRALIESLFSVVHSVEKAEQKEEDDEVE